MGVSWAAHRWRRVQKLPLLKIRYTYSTSIKLEKVTESLSSADRKFSNFHQILAILIILENKEILHFNKG